MSKMSFAFYKKKSIKKTNVHWILVYYTHWLSCSEVGDTNIKHFTIVLSGADRTQ